MKCLAFVALIADAVLVTATFQGINLSPKRTTLEPCALVASQIATQNSTSKWHMVDGNLALECLTSVPLDIGGDGLLIQAFRTAAELQSDLAYRKNPLPSDFYPAVDVLAAIDDVAYKFEIGYYKNEYALHLDLLLLARSVYDFHFSYKADISQVFIWVRPWDLVSVSRDGSSLPELYSELDVDNIDNAQADYKPSKVIKINGQDAEKWVTDLATRSPYGHDPDVNYNNVFFHGPKLNRAQQSDNVFAASLMPEGAETIFTFANGTTVSVPVYAQTKQNFTGVVDGTTFFDAYCTGPSSSPKEQASSTTTPQQVVPFAPVSKVANVTAESTYFPKAIVSTQDLAAIGYLPDDLPDTAVLSLPSFEPAEPVDFQSTVRQLLATAQAQNRTKLIIDLRGNGGGTISLAYDTFRQIFPTRLPYGISNMRSNPFWQRVSSSLYQYFVTIPPQLDTSDLTELRATVWNTQNLLTADGAKFPSEEVYLGPYKTHGDGFTATERLDISRRATTNPIDVYGYGNNTLPLREVFSQDNVVILSDGLCGSTCATFSELMKTQGRVKSIAVGGQPRLGAMQNVGGSKGSQVAPIILLKALAQLGSTAVSIMANSTSANFLTSNVLGFDQLLNRTGHEGMGVNLRNFIRRDDPSLTPLQHVYEAADCRFFYTPPMIHNQGLVWKTVRNIQWGSSRICVPGSTNHSSSLSGGSSLSSNDSSLVKVNTTSVYSGRLQVPSSVNIVVASASRSCSAVASIGSLTTSRSTSIATALVTASGRPSSPASRMTLSASSTRSALSASASASAPVPYKGSSADRTAAFTYFSGALSALAILSVLLA